MTINDRFAEMWRRSREDSGKSQDYVASVLGVSKKTIQHWETGISCPSQAMGFAWFDALDLQPLPYYLALLYPEFDGISPADDDDTITKALLTVIEDLPIDSKRKLLYVLYGDHGSSPMAILELMTAHLQTPLRARLNVAECVRSNYEIAEATSTLQQPLHIQPNIDLLNDAYTKGKESVKHRRNSYTSIVEVIK